MKKIFAFTLAEVLITLGIIGVVAAMTLPILVQNYKRHIVEVKLERFYSIMNQAISLSEAQNGDKIDWDYTLKAQDFFNSYLKDFIKVVSSEKLSSTQILVKFADGSMASFVDWQDIMYFTNNNAGNVCTNYGKNCFLFRLKPADKSVDNKYHYNKGIEPYKWAWDGDISHLTQPGKYSGFECSKEAIHRNYCTALIQSNGWKIPKDYPFKF